MEAEPVRHGRVKLSRRRVRAARWRNFLQAHQKRQIIGTKKTAMMKNQAMQTMPIFQ